VKLEFYCVRPQNTFVVLKFETSFQTSLLVTIIYAINSTFSAIFYKEICIFGIGTDINLAFSHATIFWSVGCQTSVVGELTRKPTGEFGSPAKLACFLSLYSRKKFLC